MFPKPRTQSREISRFKSPYSQTLQLLERELTHLDAKSIVIELDCDDAQIRLDGLPRADVRVNSPVVVLSFCSKHGPLSYPCDTFTRWQDNLRAIALALEALRKVDRYGVTQTGQQYKGWKALGTSATSSGDSEAAAKIISEATGVESGRIESNSAVAKSAIAAAVQAFHPDRGGDPERYKRILSARDTLRKHHAM